MKHIFLKILTIVLLAGSCTAGSFTTKNNVDLITRYLASATCIALGLCATSYLATKCNLVATLNQTNTNPWGLLKILPVSLPLLLACGAASSIFSLPAK